MRSQERAAPATAAPMKPAETKTARSCWGGHFLTIEAKYPAMNLRQAMDLADEYTRHGLTFEQATSVVYWFTLYQDGQEMWTCIDRLMAEWPDLHPGIPFALEDR